MRSYGRRGWILGAVALLVLGAGCKGFFVNQPNSISVKQAGSSTLSVIAPNSVQLTATATFNSGTKDITKSASWQSSSACATVSSTGLVKGLGPASSVTITASSGGVSGSITGSVTGGTGQALTISSNIQQPFSLSTDTSGVQFTATDSSNNNVTNSATWTSGDTAILTFSSTPGLATLVSTGTTSVTASITSSGTCSSGSETVTINQ